MGGALAPPGAKESDSQHDVIPLVGGTASNTSRVVSVPKGELRVFNTDPHRQREKGLVPVPTPQGEIIWVHPDHVEGQQ